MDSTKSTAETQPLMSDDTQVTPITTPTSQQAAPAQMKVDEETIEEKYAHQLADMGERYMIAVDGSKQSGKAFKWLLKQVAMAGDPSKVEVVIINFLPECDFSIEVSQEYQKAKHELAHCLEEYKRILGTINVASVVRLVEGAGDVREALCRHVKEEGINTLVMGNTGKSGLQRVLLGSLSEYCVRYAECAVVVVK